MVYDSGQVLQVIQIFVPATGFLVDFQMLKINELDFNAIYNVGDSFSIAFLELDT